MRPRSHVIFVMIAIVAVIAALQADAMAFTTNNRPAYGIKTMTYRFGYDNNDIMLNIMPGLGGRQSDIHAQISRSANEWSGISQLRFNLGSTCSSSCGGNSNWHWSAAYISNMGIYAYTYQLANPTPGSITRIWTMFNANHTWHISDGQTPDLYSVALHEFGHWLKLDDDPQKKYYVPGECSGYGAVMMGGVGILNSLCTDDKEAANMMYGPDTRFEAGQYLGLYQTNPLHITGVQQFNCSSGVPDYWTYSQGNTPPSGGSRSMRFSGCAIANGGDPNFAYMKLASANEDGNGKNGAPCGAGCYLRVQSGMVLRWEQNNQYSCKVSLDIEFTDGSALRDQPLVDNYGVSVHPAQRTCFSGWRSISINLSSLVNKHIKHIFVVYDDPNGSGQWRSWFDNIRITY